MKLTTREFKPDTDTNFILKSWLTTFKNTGPAVSRMLDQEYFDVYQKIVKNILNYATTTICCDSEEPDVIWGYIVYSDQAIHYVYTKETFRNLGVATHLISKTDLDHYTHYTHGVRHLLKKYPQLIYNPFLR